MRKGLLTLGLIIMGVWVGCGEPPGDLKPPVEVQQVTAPRPWWAEQPMRRLGDDWREQCNVLYRQCKTWNWGTKKGWNCYECFRNCEGQHEWPFHLCGPSIKKKK
ncbi:hypothetical protein [Archangium sp.]|uniref:hypothetical protein n=1 Tax=Archangium sp. TaxID=1872627 RepID=UPI002D49B64B|nr:hypothetical protein [Archangium sp.]HYO55696.1 hypothetical protein [Archangium sp.]